MEKYTLEAESLSLLSLSTHFLTSRNKDSAIKCNQNCQAKNKSYQIIAALSSLHTLSISIFKKVPQSN